MNQLPSFRTILSDYALFLDIDGTLLDFSSSPEKVMVPPELPVTLRTLQQCLHGALALISGRQLKDIEALFGSTIAIAAEHGALLRTADDVMIFTTAPDLALEDFKRELHAAITAYPGVMLEEKSYGVTLHWRAAPTKAKALKSLVQTLIVPYETLTMLPAHAALDIRIRGTDKASALETFMTLPPFTGRLPLFIGDDVTDEPAIARAAALGGIGLHVAHDFGGSPQAVRAWLSEGMADATPI